MLRVPSADGAALERRLSAGEFEFRPVPHARFSAKGPGVVATYYASGKLVIQGEDPEAFAARFLDLAPDAQGSARSRPEARDGDHDETPDETAVGSDESGKGDFFGPLVVAGVRLDAASARALAGGEVRDCKQMSDSSVLRVGAALRARFPHAIARLDPPEYNAQHARLRNLNPMLAELHARVIRELAGAGMKVIVDQFAREDVLLGALRGLDVALEQRPRGEEVLVVAAASVIAREQFLLALRELSQEFAVDLAKGAGPPADLAARRFVALHGIEALGRVAKLHFKTTRKIAGPKRGPR